MLKKWDEVAQIADVIDCESQNREEFIKDLQTKYSDITNIARTYASVEQTGRFDAELAQHMPKTLVSLSHNGAGYDQIDVQPLPTRAFKFPMSLFQWKVQLLLLLCFGVVMFEKLPRRTPNLV